MYPFWLSHHKELLRSAITILQNSSLPLSSSQMALYCLTSLIQLPHSHRPPAILNACFSKIFSSFLEHQASKTEDYTMARLLEQQLSIMVDKLHILIRDLLCWDILVCVLCTQVGGVQ